ncbi:MAG: hypothetical protein ACLU30_17790 [Odoribacter splanchnicus]
METVERSYKGRNDEYCHAREYNRDRRSGCTGCIPKKLSSYTGAAVTATSNEIKQVGSLNLLQALNAIDPSIRVNESLEFGSTRTGFRR